MDLVNLQFWNCMDYDFTVIVKQFVAPMEWECRTRHFGNQKGQYICTLDNYHGDFDQIDASTSEMPDEHKSFNLIELRNGQYCLYPNNRCRIFEVENDVNWGRLGDCDDYFWTTPDERREE